MTLQAGPLVFAILAVVLSGCTTSEQPNPSKAPAVFKDPLVPAAPDENTDRIRSHSASSYGAARGGAALRSPEDAYVLWNRHYGDDVQATVSAVNRDEADSVEELVAKSKDKREASKAEIARDRSVYVRRDKSTYQKPKRKETER